MWKPWLPGARPDTLATTTTLSPRCVKLTVPSAVLPAVGLRSATAVGPAGCIDAQPASEHRDRGREQGDVSCFDLLRNAAGPDAALRDGAATVRRGSRAMISDAARRWPPDDAAPGRGAR